MESDTSKDGSAVPEMHDQETASCSSQSKRTASTSQSVYKTTVSSSSMASMAGPSTSQDNKWSSSVSTEREECPVCRKQLGRKAIAIPDCCSHSYCYECIHAWVTKAKSNCPMDRKEIKFLKVYEKGQLISTESVEHKVPEEEEVTPEDEGEICPDCGWIGIRPSIGICLHCMFHHDHPWPVDDCPQCMEAESNASDEEWEPTTQSRRRGFSEGSEEEEAVSSDNNTTAESSDSDAEEEEEEVPERRQQVPAAPVVRRRAPVRRKTRRKVTRRRKRKTTTKRKTTARKSTTIKRKRKIKKRSATTTRRKRTTKRTTRKRKKVSARTNRRLGRRQIAPSDSAKARLAKLLGLRPPKDPRQTIPRGCRPRPITAAQRAAAASSASTSGMVTSRPIGSLSYHHRAQPTLHLFGGDELEYFPTDSDSECGDAGEGNVRVYRPHTSRSSDARVSWQLARQKEIISPTLPSSSSVDILGSILESQSHMRTPFDILGDGSILRHSKNGESSSSSQHRRLNLGSAGNSASQRPGSKSSGDSRWQKHTPADTSSQHSVRFECAGGSEHSNNVPSSSCSYYSYGTSEHDSAPCDTTVVSKSTESSDNDDEEIDLYGDIPNSDVAALEESSLSESRETNKTPVMSQEQHFESSLASYTSITSEGEGEEENEEKMIIDETGVSDAADQSPQSTPSTSSACDVAEAVSVDNSLLPTPTCKFGNQSPCYGGGSPAYKAADSEDHHQFQNENYSKYDAPVDVCPNLFTYSATSIDIARSFINEEDEEGKTNNQEVIEPPVTIQEPPSEPVIIDKPCIDLQTTDSKKSKKGKRRKSLVEEIFGSDVEDCIAESCNVVKPVPDSPTEVNSTIDFEGLANVSLFENVNHNVVDIEETKQMKCALGSVNSEEEERKEISLKVMNPIVLHEGPNIVDAYNVTAAPRLSSEPSSTKISGALEVNVETTVEKSPVNPDTCSQDTSSKPEIIEREVQREERKKKSSSSADTGKSNSGNVEWKRTSRSTGDRNYRVGKAKENASRDRNEKRERSSRDSRRGRTQKEKRKDLERYDVRKVINERSRREAERRRDRFGRDISRDYSHSRSPSRSPRPLSHHQPRHRRRSHESNYTCAQNRDHRYRNESCSPSYSRCSSSGSSRDSSPLPHHSAMQHTIGDDRYRKVHDKSRTRSPVRSLSKSSRRNRSRSFSRVTTIVTGRERLMSSSHLMDSVISATVANLPSNAGKKKNEKGKEKQKKDCKKKKKDRYRNEVDMIGSSDKQLSNATIPSMANCDKKKHRRERSPPASKEVFASGDNILVSVNFNKPTTSLQSLTGHASSKVANSHQSAQISKRFVKTSQQSREELHARNVSPRPQRSVIRQSKPPEQSHGHETIHHTEKSHLSCPVSSRGTSNRRKRIAAEIAAKRKPMAIIDLEASPFAERVPSPAELIILSDCESGNRTHSLSQSSHRSSIDDRMELKRRSKEEMMGQRKIMKPTKKNLSVSTANANSIATVALGPKTPPEPQIKFSINAKPQLRSILNPLHDEDDDIDLDLTGAVADSEMMLANNAVLCCAGSAIPTLIVSSHSMPSNIRGPNTPPEPQPRSSSSTKLDIESSKVKRHISPSCVDTKSPDAYDPFEPTKSPSDVSSSEGQLELSQSNIDRLSQACDSLHHTESFTPRSDSDTTSRHVSRSPVCPPQAQDPKKLSSTCEEEGDKKKECTHTQLKSPANIADSKQVPEMKPATLLFPPTLVTAQGILTSVPPNVATVLCAPQHSGLYRTVPFLLPTPSLLSLRVSQQTLQAANQQMQQQQQQQPQQQQPDTTTTTDVVDMDLESPYSPASSEGDDLFEPPDSRPATSTYLARKEKYHGSKQNSHSKSNADKFDKLFNQSSTPLKKEVSSTSGNRGQLTGRTSHGRKTGSKNQHTKSSKLTIVQKTRRKSLGTFEKNKSGKKEIAIRMDEDQLKILDSLPSSAVEMQVKEKFLKKLNRQERVVEEVKLALKPHYTKKVINKQEYKDILRRSVPKICHNKTGEINPIRIRLLIGEYVKKFKHAKKKESTKHRGKADKQRC